MVTGEESESLGSLALAVKFGITDCQVFQNATKCLPP